VSIQARIKSRSGRLISGCFLIKISANGAAPDPIVRGGRICAVCTLPLLQFRKPVMRCLISDS